MTGRPTPTRILIVGGGGREHALAWRLAGEPGVNEIIVAPGSDAIAGESRVRCLGQVDPLDGASVVAAARAVAAELVVIGPEAPLAAGVADACAAAGVPVFGPTAAAARIETSKAFCHEIAAAAGVPMARAAVFESGDTAGAAAFARALDADGLGIVVKADGLAAGKGVTVCDSLAQAIPVIATAVADGRVVIEERLTGLETSAIALCDGRSAVALPLARDHKRLSDGDRGPNTGGMGAYSPLPDLPDADAETLVDRFHRPILDELARRGSPFRGALYAGLMLTRRGPVLLECNARFGDPETQVILPRLGGALGPLLSAAAQGRLGDAQVPVLPGAAVGIVLAAAGYPATPRAGDAITGLDLVRDTDALVFHAGTVRDRDGTYRTRGGRVLTVVGEGRDLAAAAARAGDAAGRIAWSGLQRRHDIGLTGLDAGAATAMAAAR